MKTLVAAAAIGLAFFAASPASAKGCLKGALVGGVAGHYAHHGVLGAAAGCIIGRHEAKKNEKMQAQGTQTNPQYR